MNDTDTDDAEPAHSSVERRFRAMGTDVSVVVVGGSESGLGELADLAVARVEQLEQRWSRFLPDSEVSRLNTTPGGVEVSDDTLELIVTAIEAWRVSGGYVDCTELQALIDAGYDRSFEQVPTQRDLDEVDDLPARPLSLLGPADIVIDGSRVTLPAGVGFDPGGIGKGLAADIISTEVMDAGADGVCINVGGDLCVRGISPTGPGWTISIDHPSSSEPVSVVGLVDGAIASSTVLRRSWRVGDETRHHLIDPGTGRPTESDIEFASVISDVGWRAETLTKAVLLRGGPHPFDLIDGTASAALAVRRDGTIVTSSGWAAFTGGVEPTLTRGRSETAEEES